MGVKALHRKEINGIFNRKDSRKNLAGGWTILLWIFLLFSLWTTHAAKAWAQASGPVDLTTAIADVAQKSMPAVVHIEVTQKVDVPPSVSPFESDPFFRYFFGVPQGPRSHKREMRGIGSGMIIDSEGHIVTNHHVVSGATRINVKMASGEELEAKIVGIDPKTDLAVLKIKPPKNIPYLVFGNSDKLRVGEWVVAIGNARGLEQTVTAGIISAKHRVGILDPSSYQDYIQTDAAINPGNSGGPLLNLAGEVVGVNAAIVSESGGFEGIGFAIPSNMTKAIAGDLIKTGKVVRGWIGISVQDVTPLLAKSMNMKVLKGVWITEVFKGGPAEKAGILKGDVAVSYDGTPLENANDFRNQVAVTRVGKKVDVGILRKGEKISIQVEVSAYKHAPRIAALGLKNKLGIEVKEISILEARRRRLDSREGVVLAKVDANGPAGRAGLETGDIILQINNLAVRGINDYARILEQIQKDEEVLLLVRDMRTGDMGYLTVLAQ
jgi:serine protease Do